MVEWDNQQVSSHLMPSRHISSSKQNHVFDLASSVSEQWLTSDIINLNNETEIKNCLLPDINHKKILEPIFQDVKYACVNEKNILDTSNVMSIPRHFQNEDINVCDFTDPWELNYDITLHNDFTVDSNSVSLWGSSVDLCSLKMDDVFQVDKVDFFQGPTLAELNANDESLFDSLDNFDLYLLSESKETQKIKCSKSQTEASFVSFHPDLNCSCVNVNVQNSKTDNNKDSLSVEKHAVFPVFTSGKENIKCSNYSVPQNVDMINGSSSLHENPKVRFSEVQNSFIDQPKHSISDAVTISVNLSENQVSMKGNISSKPKKATEDEVCVLLSNDEGFDSQEENSDNDCLFSSEGETPDETEEIPRCHSRNEKWKRSKKKTRYFWQYNIQSKGPKRPKLKLCGNSVNFLPLAKVRESVCDTAKFLRDVKHTGKARRGDGNDLTPNPRKLYSIGLELQKLNAIINDLTPVNELPFNARPKSRKEKNKLASRACRLKKKAQHEANKLKLYGLQQEHKCLLNILTEIKKIVKHKLRCGKSSKESCHEKVNVLINNITFSRVAGCSAEYVNMILDKVASGNLNSGLN